MSDHPSHKLDTYKPLGEHKFIMFCVVCSREEENLSTPCPGRFVLLNRADKEVDKKEEPK